MTLAELMQLRSDRDNGVLLCRKTIDALIDHAIARENQPTEVEQDAALVKALTEGAQIDTPSLMNWIADRLVHVYGESPNMDFVLTLRERSKKIRAALAAHALQTQGVI